MMVQTAVLSSLPDVSRAHDQYQHPGIYRGDHSRFCVLFNNHDITDFSIETFAKCGGMAFTPASAGIMRALTKSFASPLKKWR